MYNVQCYDVIQCKPNQLLIDFNSFFSSNQISNQESLCIKYSSLNLVNNLCTSSSLQEQMPFPGFVFTMQVKIKPGRGVCSCRLLYWSKQNQNKKRNLLEPPAVKFADLTTISKQFIVTLSVACPT